MVGPNYKPSRIELTSKHAKKWLDKTIKNYVVYKYPQDFVLLEMTQFLLKDSTMHIFQDKRILLRDDLYRFCSNRVVCYWDKNVDREFTGSTTLTL